MPFPVSVVVGSLRAASLSRKIAQALIARAPKTLACEIIEIGDLPLYNEDLDAAPPPPWSRFREEVQASSAILFVTPEYNRSLPGGLKNAIDVGSRPPGRSVFDRMPAGVVSVTPYKLGAFGANHALRQTFAPPVYVTTDHAATFQVPSGLWFCPLSYDWVGSDHGTMLFLVRPKACEGAGYPSSARFVTDDHVVPVISVCYGYDMSGDMPAPPCLPDGHIVLVGKPRPLCRETVEGGIRLTARATYMADLSTEIDISLTTTPARLDADLPTLRKLAASFRSCRVFLPAEGKFKAQRYGHGPKCPRNGSSF